MTKASATVVEEDTVQTEKFSIWYRVDSISVDPDYLSNRRQIDRIIHYLEASPRIDSITIFAWASPEGGYRHNKWLSEERAKSAKEFLLSQRTDTIRLNADKIKISPIAENWEGLIELVEERYWLKDRDKVIDILYAKGISDETRKWRLQQLDKGRTWRYLIDNYMPELRAATWLCVWAPAPPMLPPLEEISDTLSCEAGTLVRHTPSPHSPIYETRHTIMAFKTNLLYDFVSFLNFSVELPVFKDKLSILYYHQFPWWTWGQAGVSIRRSTY